MLTGPVCVTADGQFSWSSDEADQVKGWSICVDVPTAAPIPPPTPSPPSHIFVIQGHCDIVGECVQSPNYPANDGSYQSCTIGFQSDGTLFVDQFATENGFDFVLLDGETYVGLTGTAHRRRPHVSKRSCGRGGCKSPYLSCLSLSLLCSICSYQSSVTALVTDSSTHTRWLKSRAEKSTCHAHC